MAFSSLYAGITMETSCAAVSKSRFTNQLLRRKMIGHTRRACTAGLRVDAHHSEVVVLVDGLKELGIGDDGRIGAPVFGTHDRVHRLVELAQNRERGRVQFPRRIECTAHVLSLIHISEPTRLLSISYAVFCL